MAMFFFCGLTLPVGHLAREWRQLETSQVGTGEIPTEWDRWLDFAAALPRRHSRNHNVHQYSEAMDRQWQEQLRLGWLRPTPPSDIHSIVPMLAIVRDSDEAKARATGQPVKVRFCSDLTASGMNERTPNWRFKYVTLRDLLTRVKRGWSAAVNDCTKMFRQLGWAKAMYPYLGLRWRGSTVVDERLSFGSSAAPGFAQTASAAIVDVIRRRAQDELGLTADNSAVLVYLDDVISCAHSREAAAALERIVLEEFEAHGLPCSPEKRQFGQVVTWLGWQLNLREARLYITPDRLGRLHAAIRATLEARGVRTRRLRRLAGQLSFVVDVVPGGRGHLASLWAELASRSADGRAVRAVSAAARRDLQWLDHHLQRAQGTSLWRDFTSSVVIITDAAMDQTASGVEGPLGFGAICFAPETVSVMQHRWNAEELQWFAHVRDTQPFGKCTRPSRRRHTGGKNLPR